MRKYQFLVPLLISAVAAWNEDDRCLRRRGLEETFPFDFVDVNPSDNAPDGNHKGPIERESLTESSKSTSLRGGHHTSRRLEADFRFHMKLHWEEGYCWQLEWDERKWCLECEKSTCGEDDYLWIKKCDTNDKRQWFVRQVVNQEKKEIKLKPYTAQHLCLTRTRVRAHQLKPCSDDMFLDGSGRDKQVLIGFDKDEPFELYPNGRDEEHDCFECPMCLNQHHHPKSNEVVRGQDCETAREDKTSKWDVWEAHDIDDVGRGIGVGSGAGSAGSNDLLWIDCRGIEYCEHHACGVCMGDCDNDDECEGHLKCYKRQRYENVPGCRGGDEDGTKRDYCYDPYWIDGGEARHPNLDYRGREYCSEEHKCGLCVGDCDSDDECEDGLICYKRKRYEDVPGCVGGAQDRTTKDFCAYPS